MSYPLRIPPYMDWVDSQAPRVMATRQRRASATMSGLALLEVLAAQQRLADATARYDHTQSGQIRTGVRQLINRH